MEAFPRQARGLAGLGHDVHVLRVGKGEEPETTTTDGVACHRRKQADNWKRAERVLLRPLSRRWASAAVGAFAQSES